MEEIELRYLGPRRGLARAERGSHLQQRLLRHRAKGVLQVTRALLRRGSCILGRGSKGQRRERVSPVSLVVGVFVLTSGSQ